MRRAVITGLGIVSSIGNNKDEVTTSLREGRSGITFSEEFEQAGMRSQVWGKVDLDIKEHIESNIINNIKIPEVLEICEILISYDLQCAKDRVDILTATLQIISSFL